MSIENPEVRYNIMNFIQENINNDWDWELLSKSNYLTSELLISKNNMPWNWELLSWLDNIMTKIGIGKL